MKETEKRAQQTSNEFKAKQGLIQLKKQIKRVQKSKVPKIGLLERIKLSSIGKKDGNLGFPKPDTDNIWRSPFIKEEIDGYARASSHSWTQCQLNTDWAHQEKAVLKKQIESLKQQLETANENFPTTPSQSDLLSRHPGEELLTDTQVIKRRRKDYDKKCATFNQSIQEKSDSLQKAIEQEETLSQFIEQSEILTRLLCENAKAKASQRIDIYYHSASKVHDKRLDMPSYPIIHFDDFAEEKYFAHHQNNH